MERPTNIIGKWIQPGLVYWPWVCNTIKLRSLLPFALAEGLICNKKLALAERELWLKPSYFWALHPSAKADGNKKAKAILNFKG